MARDVKDFLYVWCQKRKHCDPEYKINSQKAKKIAEVKIKNYPDLVGYGTGQNSKLARTAAALDLCDRLVTNGMMTAEEFEQRQPSCENRKPRIGNKRRARDQDNRFEDEIICISNGSTGVYKKMRLADVSDSNAASGGGQDGASATVQGGQLDGSAQVPYHDQQRNQNQCPDQDRAHDQITDRDQSEDGDGDCVACVDIGGSTSTSDTSEKMGHATSTVSATLEDDEIEIIDEVSRANTAEPNRKQQLKRRLDEDIWEHYRRNKQPSSVFDWKLATLDYLASLLKPLFPQFRLFPFGSTVTGLGSYNSDMDACLVVYDRGRFGEEIINNSRSYATGVLRRCAKAFRRCRNIRYLQFIPAKVPILRLEFYDEYSCVEVDINCNNLPGIRNSHLLHHYAGVDERFPALSLVIKHWAVVSGINDASEGTLSSYCLILLVIHYLQYGVTQVAFPATKPLLPNLQELFPRFFWADIDVRAMRLEKLQIPPQFSSSHCQLTMAELLLGFFNYYANYFDFDKWAPSIRTAGIIKNKKSNFVQCSKNMIAVEEPYECSNVARAVGCRETFYRIVNAFEGAYKNLWGKLTLDAIGVKLSR